MKPTLPTFLLAWSVIAGCTGYFIVQIGEKALPISILMVMATAVACQQAR